MKGLISETRIHNKNDKPVTYSRSMVRDNEKNRRIEAMRNFDIAYSFVRESDSTFASKRRKCLVTVADILRLSRISPWRNWGRRGSRGERLEENAARGKLLSSQRLCAFLRNLQTFGDAPRERTYSGRILPFLPSSFFLSNISIE